MLRTISSVLAAGVLAISAAACSASNGQSGCNQPPVQHYPAPQLIAPAPGAIGVPDNVGVIQISTQTPTIVGSLALKSSSGANVAIGSAVLAAQQPNPNAYLWLVKIGGLKAATTYTLSSTVQYPGACLGPVITTTQTIASFTSQ